MKRWIHSATDLITRKDIKKDCNEFWGLLIDTDNIIAFVNDEDIVFAIDLNQAENFLNSREAIDVITEADEYNESLCEVLTTAYADGYNCGVKCYESTSDIIKLYNSLNIEVPDYLR